MALRRHMLTVGGFLLVGSVVNVGIAWGCAAWHYVGRAPRIAADTVLDGSGTSWLLASYRSSVARRVHSAWGPFELGYNQDSRQSLEELAHGWAHLLEPGREVAGMRAVDARGWPMLCMWSALEFDVASQQFGGSAPSFTPGKVTRIIRGIELTPYPQYGTEAPPHRYRVLPLGIIWTGFAVNTVAFAAVGLCLLAGFQVSRRAIRIGACRCPGCAYDLRHVQRDQCPECGFVRLSRIGSRGARWVRLAVIMGWSALALIVIVGGGRLLWPWIGVRNWDAYKPTSWLLAQARSFDAEKSGSALNELLTRFEDDKLSQETILSLVRDALAIQADVEHPWVSQWGDVVTSARLDNLVSDEDWQLFARQAIVPELLVRPGIVEGDELAAKLILHKRAPSSQVFVLGLRHLDTRLGDQTFFLLNKNMRTQLSRAVATAGGTSHSAFIAVDYGGGGLISWGIPAEPIIVDVAPGDHTLASSWKVVISEGTITAGWAGSTTTLDLFDGTIDLRASVTVLPRGSQTVELVRDESLRPAVEASLKLRYCRARNPDSVTFLADDWLVESDRTRTRIDGMFEIDAPPMDIAFNVFLRAGETEWGVGRIDSESLQPWDFTGRFTGSANGLEEMRVDVILRPSQEAASRTVGITKIWDGEIVLEDVSLEWWD